MVIDSSHNKQDDFFYGKIFFKEIVWVNIILYILFFLFLDLTIYQSIVVAAFLFLSSILVTYLIGIKRKKNIQKISNFIDLMKKNQNKTLENNSLEPSLIEIENDLKELFDSNSRDIAEVKRLAQARSDFLGNVSHELRTPIFSIQGFLETLLDGAIEDQNVNRRFIKKAYKHTKNLNALLNDLIDISMIESGEMRMKPKYFDIVELLETVTEDLSSIADEKGIKIKAKYFSNEIFAFGDSDRLKQVIVNLISNGIKYSSDGKILISITKIDGELLISVKDNGPGISEIDLPRIFERFYRIDKTRSKDVRGTGLGLSIVKHIIEAHGSKIEVISKLGKGSTFSFRLRMKQ